MIIFKDQLRGFLLVGVDGEVQQEVGDAHHPHEDRDDGGQDEVLEVLFVRVQLHVDDVVRHDGEGGEEESELADLHDDVHHGHHFLVGRLETPGADFVVFVALPGEKGGARGLQRSQLCLGCFGLSFLIENVSARHPRENQLHYQMNK